MKFDKREMEILTAGSDPVCWSPDSAEEVKKAEKVFNELTKQGYRAYGKESGAVKQFDPESDVTMVPRIVGG
jgi:hypothetical protein